ncbi:phosphotransferase [Legionella cardiaca]|uniref:Phosphotransferase n=1 Tax=Legionella cardiaca TaxID=1071983 RepID=A0ABY8ATZ7_9GAMM|nr:phosphotransferase [Legionella cardiaca]WED42846.1 phosphotransferase [Legionella cardiaca]
MKLRFFGQKNAAIPERLFMHILSFLPPEELNKLLLVNKSWMKLTEKTKSRLTVIPMMQRIPQFKPYDFGQLGFYPATGGMTNCTHKVRQRKMLKWVLRVPGKGSSAFINREDEAYNAKQASELGLNVTIEFFDPKDGLQLTRYIDNNRSLAKELKTNPLILETVADAQRCLHSSPLFRNEVNMFSRNTKLLDLLKSKNSAILPQDIKEIELMMEQIEKLVRCYDIPLSPCHNDATVENFLVSGTAEDSRIRWLDWEYSANNDRLIDLVYFLRDAKLSSEQMQLFITRYFGYYDKTIQAWLTLYMPVIDWWYTIWSWTQISNEANGCEMEKYRDLAEKSYKQTKDSLESLEYKQAFTLIQEETQSQTFSKKRTF